MNNISKNNESVNDKDWETPILFDGVQTPDIPAHFLPCWLGAFGEAVARNTQTPPGLSVMLGISTVATCVQKRFVVAPYNDDYREPASIWTCTALPPAARKTAVFNLFIELLNDWETEQAEAMRDEITKVETQRSVIQKRIDKLQADAAKTDSNTERENLVNEINQIKEQMPEAVNVPRIYTGDVTPERLQNFMVEQGERMAVLSDEGGIFEVMSGMYSDGAMNIDIFLNGHAGSPVRVDRGTRTAVLNKPALTFGLAVQPDIIRELASGRKKKFRGNGALARFLYCIPRSNIGYRDVRKRTPIPENVKQAYNDGIRRLLNIPQVFNLDGIEKPRILTLDDNAREAWHKFSQSIEAKQGEGREYESIQDWTGKLPGAALRIAGLFHVVEYGTETTIITIKTIESTLDLCELLIEHAKAAFEMMGDSKVTTDAIKVFQWIIAKKEKRFRKNDLHSDLHGRFTKVDRLEYALKELTSRNIIGEPIKEPTGRRPSIWYDVNPKVLEG